MGESGGSDDALQSYLYLTIYPPLHFTVSRIAQCNNDGIDFERWTKEAASITLSRVTFITLKILYRCRLIGFVQHYRGELRLFNYGQFETNVRELQRMAKTLVAL